MPNAINVATSRISLGLGHFRSRSCLLHAGMLPEQKIPTWTSCVRTLGEPGTVIIGKNRELCDPGITMCVGPTDGHTGDVYRMWNEKTNKYSETRDAIWLSCMIFKEKIEDYKEESNSHGKV